jgi:hypothetical protein
VKPLTVLASALVAVLAVGCSNRAPDPPDPPMPFSTPVPHPKCTTSDAKGRCGPYDGYRRITGTTSSTYVGNNVWNPVPDWRQTLYATDPGNWQVSANIPAGNTAVVSYPSIAANYGQITFVPTPLTSYSAIYSSFSEIMNATDSTSAWAAYDIWLGEGGCSPAGSNCTSNEVMIQHDFANNGACTTVATAAFGGSGGVPVRDWHLCRYGSQLIWKLGADEENKRSERSGSVDILSMLTWLVDHEYLPAGTGLWMIAYGWEICSTGGANEDFVVKDFSITPTPSGRAAASSSPP